MKHYIRLRTLSPFTCKYAYLDYTDYIADALLARNRVHAKFMKEYAKQGSNFVVVLVRCPKREEDSLIDALRKIPDNAILLGRTGYMEMVKELKDAFNN